MPNVGVTFDFAAESAKLRSEIDKVRRDIGGLKKTNDDIISSFKSVGTAIIGAFSLGTIVSQMASAAKAAIAFGDEMQKAAARTGIAASEFSALAGAAKMADVDTTALSKALQKMQVAISEAGSGSKTQLATFEALGIKFDELRQLAPEDQFLRIADQINKLQDPADRVRASVELFGKAGADLLPFFEQGAEGIRKATDEIERMGGKLTDEQISKLADADEAIKRLDSSWANFAQTLTAAVAPALTAVLDTLSGKATIGGVETALGLQLDKLKELNKERAIYAQPGYDKSVLADLDKQIAETTAKIAKLRAELYALEGPASGPLRRTNAAAAEAIPPGFLPPPGKPPTDKSGGQGAKQEKTPGFAFGAIPENFTESQMLANVVPAQDPRVLLEAQVQEEILAVRDQYNATALGQLDAFNSSVLGSVFNNAQAQIDIERYKTMTAGEITQEGVATAISGFGGLGKIGKAFSIAQTIWSTSTAIMKAMSEIPYPANIAAAAAIAAKGAVQLATIKKTNIGSSGGIAQPGGGVASSASPVLSSNVPAASTESQQRNAVTINVNGSLFAAQETVDWLLGKISEAVNGRDVVFINGDSRQAMELAPA